VEAARAISARWKQWLSLFLSCNSPDDRSIFAQAKHVCARQPASPRPTAAGRARNLPTSSGNQLACWLWEETDFYGSQP
jgi:hypothetical protein